MHPRLDLHERVRRPHQSRADRRHDHARWSISPASSSTPISTRRARRTSASTSWSRRSDGIRIGFTQIAGLVARRIVPFVKPGDIVAAGQRVGLIRFGSRVDVYLPAGTAPQVLLGQRTIAGETVLARRRSRPTARRGRQPVRASSAAAPRRGIPLRALVPNAITALALCSGPDRHPLRHRRASGRRRSRAIILAGVLDGLDGRIARLLQGRRAGSAPNSIRFPTSPPSASRRRSSSICGRCERLSPKRSAGCSRLAMPSAARCGWRGSTPRSMSRNSRTNRPAS